MNVPVTSTGKLNDVPGHKSEKGRAPGTKLFTQTDKLDEVPAPQTLIGVTVIFPHHPEAGAVKVMEFELFVGEVTTAPGGNIQEYELALVTGAIE